MRFSVFLLFVTSFVHICEFKPAEAFWENMADYWNMFVPTMSGSLSTRASYGSSFPEMGGSRNRGPPGYPGREGGYPGRGGEYPGRGGGYPGRGGASPGRGSGSKLIAYLFVAIFKIKKIETSGSSTNILFF